MDERNTRIERALLRVGAVLAVVAGTFTALNGFFEAIKTSVETVLPFAGRLTNWQLLLLGAFLLLAAVWAFMASRRRSVLQRPEALRLERGNRDHLIGREDDIENISRLCREQPLVFLEGESGAGKSALIQAGLLPSLSDTRKRPLLG